MTAFSFPHITHKHGFSTREREAFRIHPRPMPSTWANENLTLCTGGYDIPGKLTLKPYQIEPVDSIMNWHRIIFKGPTRTFKSGMADVMMFYGMSVLGVNGIVAYAEENTVSLVFRTRIKQMIMQNKCLREAWDGVQDNLSQEKILLRTCFWRVASAQNRNTLASTGAGFVIGSEVGKWEKMDYNPVHMLYGRQDAYPHELRRSIIESTPYDVGDYFYQEIFRPGTLILRPHYPCALCGEYQVLTDSQIKLRKTGVDDPTHEAARIRAEKEGAVFYECIHCRQEIREKDRAEIDSRVIWAAPEIIEGDFFKQEAEKISRAGEITNSNRKKFDAICFDWNRLVDLNFTFYECLARFFDSVHNPEKKKIYETETMARFWRKKHERINISRFEAAKDNYHMTGIDNLIPNDVLIVTIGIDSQDKDFYFVIQGWGAGMSSWILRYGTIYWPIADPAFQDRRKLLDTVLKGMFGGRELKRKDGAVLSPRLGFIDRGGHRPEDVDFLVSNISFLQAYVGLRYPDPKKELVYKSDNGNFWLGQSEVLSEYVGLLMETDQFKIAKDTDYNFLSQITKHFHVNKTDPYGNSKSVWVKLSGDHYRSCLNMSYAAAKVLRVDTALLNDSVLAKIKSQLEQTRPGAELPKEKPEQPQQGRNQNRYGNNEYYSRALR